MLVHTHWGGRRGKEKHEGVGELLVDLEIGIVEIKRFSFSFMFLHFTCSHHTVNCQRKQAWSDLQLCFNLEHNLFNSADYWIYIKLTLHLPSRIYSPPFQFCRIKIALLFMRNVSLWIYWRVMKETVKDTKIFNLLAFRRRGADEPLPYLTHRLCIKDGASFWV